MTPASATLFSNDRCFVSPATYDAFFAVIERLEATVAEETAALGSGRHRELAKLTRQKRQGLLELSRISQSLAGTIPSQDIIARLASFRATLAANDALLRVHLSAIKDVTDTIVRAMREAESDGTYSRAYSRADYDFA